MTVRLTAFALVVTVGLGSTSAGAYVCTAAFDGGPSLAWSEREVRMKAVIRDADEVDAAEVVDALVFGAQAWTEVSCSDMQLLSLDATDDARAGFDWEAGAGAPENENILVFRSDAPNEAADAWLHPVSALAITTVTYVRTSGRILDADIEMNDGNFVFSACEPGGGCDVVYDIKNTITHELGHVLGLDHPPASQPGAAGATMFATANAGDVDKRTLEDDDRLGMCLIYPAGNPTGECYGIDRKEPPDVTITPTFGCQTAGEPSTLWGLLGAAALWVRRASRRSCKRRAAC